MVIDALRRRSFEIRYLILFGGEAFSKVCVLIVFAYLARSLGPREFGVIELAISITIFFVLGVESGLGSYGARLVASNPQSIGQLVPRVILLRATLGIPAYLVIVFGSAVYGLPGVGIVAIYGLSVLISPFFTGWVSQGLRQMQWVAGGTALRNFVFALLVFLLVRPGSDIRLVAVAEIVGAATLALFNAYVLHGRFKVSLDWHGAASGARRMFKETWYLGASDLTWACLWYSPSIVLGAMGIARTEYVAWLAASVRIVMALHTFVFLYFFNLLPNLTKELIDGVDQWRALVRRSVTTSAWLSCFVALGGTLMAPTIVTTIYGTQYAEAVRPFQIVIWMIPVAWFSGHLRFSLIAAGQQKWEFRVSAITGLFTVALAVALVYVHGSVGAAIALLTGGVVNTVLAILVCDRVVGKISVFPQIRGIVLTCAICLAGGLFLGRWVDHRVGPVIACVAYAVVMTRQNMHFLKGRLERLGRKLGLLQAR